MKKLFLSLIIVLSFSIFNLKAGHGMPLVNPSFTVGTTGLTFTASSNAATCGGGPYWLQVELRCTSSQLTGTPPSTMQTNLLNWTGPGVNYNSFPWFNSLLNVPNYTFPTWTDNCTTEPYNSVFISFTGLCPGQTYFFSAREWVSGTNSVGPWTTPSSFVVPGTFVPLNFNVTASPSIFCSPGSSTLTISSITGGCGQTNIQWLPGGSTLNPIVVSPASTTNYTALVTTPCNTLSKVITVTVVPNVSAAFTPLNTNTCAGIPVQYNHTGTAGVSHIWSVFPIGATISSNTISNPSITFNNPGLYTISHTVSVGTCSNVVTTTANITGIGASFTSSNPNQCLQNNSFTFNSTATVGTQSYTFSPSIGSPPSSNTPNYGPVSFTSPGTYTVTYSNTNSGCTSSTYSVINIYPTPTLAVSNSGPVCEGNNINLTLTTTATSYSWTGPNGFTSTLQNPSITSTSVANSGTYQINVASVNNCTNTSNTNVVINPPPQITVTTPTACSGGSFSINSFGGINYTWTGPNSYTSNSQNLFFTNANSNLNGLYTVVGTDVNGCIGTNTVLVNVNPSFTISINNNSPICAGSVLQLNSPPGFIYNWSGPNGFSSTQQTPQLSNVSSQTTGQYSLNVQDNNGCQGSAVTNVIVNPSPQLSITNSKDKICTPACVDFTLNASSSLASLIWEFISGVSTNTNTSTQCYTKGGIYTSTATATDVNGCISVITHSVEVYDTPTADFIFSPLKPIENEYVQFSNASYGAPLTSMINGWYINNELTSFANSPQIAFQYPGDYLVTLIVLTTHGCSDTISKIVNIKENYYLWVPNSFTPNNDGLNDTFQPKGQGIAKYELMVFDRWGEMIFKTKEFNQGWDGKHHRGIDYGIYCKDDVYTWLIKVTDVFGKSHELKGHVTLIK